jgi:hypothetical protein
MTACLVVSGGGDDETATTTTRPPVTVPDEPVPDDEVATLLLPAVGALGPEWIETIHDTESTEVEPIEAGECPPGPVPAGFLVRSEHRRTEGQALVEALAVTAGVVTEGVEPISLDDEFVAGCLLDGLRDQLGAGATAELGPEAEVGAINPGALVSHVGFVVDGPEGVGGTFDFVLVQRGRLVSMGLLTNTGESAPTSLRSVATALDAPLQAALPAVS